MAKKSKKHASRRKEASRRAPGPDPSQRLEARSALAGGELKFIATVFVIALALRLTYFWLNRSSNPLFYHLILDALFHHEWALEINSGNFWGDEVFFRAPLYPYLVAFVYKITNNSIGAAIFIQHVLGAFSTVLVYVLTRFFFAPAVALVAGLFAALYWPFIFFEGELLIVTLVVALDLVLLICLTLAIRSQRRGYFILAGIFCGSASWANVGRTIPASRNRSTLCS